MVDFINDVVEADEYVYRDLIKCCEYFISNDTLFDGNKNVGNEIWETPIIAHHLVKNYANRSIIKTIFETLCVFEKSVPSSGIGFIHSILENDLCYSRNIRARFSFIFKQVNKFVRCESTKEILRIIRKHGNPSISLNVSRDVLEKPIIKFSNLPRVKIQIPEGFIAKSNVFNNCNFFMIDGAVAKSSELAVLMNRSFEEKNKTYFLVAKSFNEEVLNMIKANYDRGLVNVIPLEYGFDLESINSLADLVSVVGGLPLSPTMGDVISAANFDRLGHSDECKILGSDIIIRSSLNNLAHRNNIIRQIDEADSDAKKELLSKRLSGLSSNICKIILPKKSKYNSIERNIKYTSLLLKEMVQNPIVEYRFRKQKFYISNYAFKIQTDIGEKIQNLLKTKIILARRERWIEMQ